MDSKIKINDNCNLTITITVHHNVEYNVKNTLKDAEMNIPRTIIGKQNEIE